MHSFHDDLLISLISPPFQIQTRKPRPNGASARFLGQNGRRARTEPQKGGIFGRYCGQAATIPKRANLLKYSPTLIYFKLRNITNKCMIQVRSRVNSAQTLSGINGMLSQHSPAKRLTWALWAPYFIVPCASSLWLWGHRDFASTYKAKPLTV